MSIFKCKMCGGTLEINNNETVAECAYCGTKQTLPKLDDEKRANLYDRANHFRRNNEFDKASAIYEQILNEDGSDAEAYWSLVLCRYGIEYVEDPTSHKRVPTVNRAQFTSIFDDDNYKSALQYADGYQRNIYEEEAKSINEIQKGILAISQKEEPFDVFICYKETDNNGRRTPDSVLANDLYHQLTQEGFKVFFARITLEDKLGSAYEPYIFAALNSAKVMVVLGTKPEFFKAVWVRNEWSRYLALIKQGQKKMLIPAYKDMDPYDLPEEFSHLQAQDMSKLGFMQDLIRGIKKLITVEEPQPKVSAPASAPKKTKQNSLEDKLRKIKEKQAKKEQIKAENHNLKPVKRTWMLIVSIVLFLIPILIYLVNPIAFYRGEYETFESIFNAVSPINAIYLAAALLLLMQLVAAIVFSGSRILVGSFFTTYTIYVCLREILGEGLNNGFGYSHELHEWDVPFYKPLCLILFLIIVLLNTLPIKKVYFSWSKWVAILPTVIGICVCIYVCSDMLGGYCDFAALMFTIEMLACFILVFNILPPFINTEKSIRATYAEGKRLLMSNRIQNLEKSAELFKSVSGFAKADEYAQKALIKAEKVKTNDKKSIIIKSAVCVGVFVLSIIIAIVAVSDYSNNKFKELKYQTAVEAASDNYNYVYEVRAFEELGDYKDSAALAIESKYKWAKEYYSPDKERTYKYLKQLKGMNYKDSAKLYDKLFTSWKAEGAFYTSNEYGASPVSTIGRYEDYLRVEFKFVSGIPNETIDIYHITYWDDGNINRSDWLWEDYTVNRGTFSAVWNDGISNAPRGTLTVKAFNAKTNELIGTASVQVK